MNALSDTAAVDADRAATLLARIEAFGFSAPDDPLGFESRLADDQGWTLGYALAVAAQYRRFLVLTQVAGHAVGPSPDVDEAWHLHLTRTAHYETFCASVFGRFLHHEPARAGEGARQRDMYRETLEDYRRAFGAEPPAPIWPAPGQPAPPHFAQPAGWPVPQDLLAGIRFPIAALLATAVAGYVLCEIDLLTPLQTIPPLAFLGVAWAITLALGWLGLVTDIAPVRASERDILEPYEAAWLSGGAERMAMTAIVALTERGVLLAPGKPPERGPRRPIPFNATVEPRCVHPAEVVCVGAIKDGGLNFGAACRAMWPLADQIERRLVAAGVAADADRVPQRQARTLLALLALLLVEFERIFHAFGTSQRIGFLVMLTLAQVVLVFFLAQRRPRLTARAERALKPLRFTAGRYKKVPPVGEALAFGVALIGSTALADELRFEGLGQQVNALPIGALQRRPAAKSGPDSSCSSCSSCSSDAGSGGSSSCSGGSSCGSSCSSGCGGGSGSSD